MQIFLSLGERLREERKRLGFTQEAFATTASTSVQTVNSYEAGRSDPKTSYLSAIAAAGADTQYIITGMRSSSLAPALPPDETALLDAYRQADNPGKAALLVTAKALAAMSKS